MKRQLLVCLMALTGSAAWGQGFMTNPYGRTFESLNGEWNTLVDPYLIGTDRAREVFRDKKQEPALFYEYAFEGARPMQVPGDWNHQYPDLDWYEGTLWYARRFPSPTENARRHFLYFGGVSSRCTVYLNGEELGSHEGAFTPFQFEVSGLLRQGEDNFLCVAVDNVRRKEAIPALSFDWWNYGGITRDVMLVSVPEVYISSYFIRLSPDGRHIVLEAGADGAKGGRIRLEIPSLKVDKTFPVGEDGHVAVSLPVKGLEYWSPAHPRLYDVRLSLLEGRSTLDEVADRIGFRTIRTEGEKLLLNGEEVFLRGISFHEEIAQEGRRACTEADARQLLGAARELGCNMIRLSHYPQNEHIIRLADEMGFLLWEEIPLWQGIDFTDEQTYARAEQYLEEMIHRDRNRCSIGFWSLSNETRPGAERDAFLSRLLARGRALDGSRLFTSAFSIVRMDGETGRVSMEDRFADEVDVVGINMYMGWYVPWQMGPEAFQWDVARGKPLVFSEFGGEALSGRFGHADRADSWSEDYQAKLYADNLRMIDRIGNLAGVVPWLLYDFRSPFRLHPELQQGWNRKGVLSQWGDKKKAWWVLRDYFRDRENQAPAVAERPRYKDASLPVEERVEDLLRRMTMREKAFQLTQYSLGRNTNINNIGERIGELPVETGSLIYHGDDPRLRNLVQKRAMEESRLGIPMLFAYDVIHGFKTIFPVPLAQACSWAPDLVERSCAIAASEARRTGIEWTFSPMVDIGRDPRWGRVVEGYGEDPYASAVYAAAAVVGYQGRKVAEGDFSELSGEERVLACLKHFVGYGGSEAGRDYVYTEISDQTLWDTYLPPYEAGVKAGALSIMSGFNDISGVPATAHSYALNEVLRKRWGFPGVVISDWAAVAQLCLQGYSADLKDATESAFRSGIDIDMQSLAYEEQLEALVREGRLPMGAVDDAVRRVLTLKFRLGLFEKPYTPDHPASTRFLLPEALQLSEELAAASVVLLKNEDLLPLSGVRNLTVAGPLADRAEALLGSWTARGSAGDTETLLSAIRREFSAQATVHYVPGYSLEGSSSDEELEEAVAAARRSDAVILCLGEKEDESGENASRASLSLPDGQLRLLEALCGTGTPVVVVLLNGRPLDLVRVSALSTALLEAWQPGTRGAAAVAGILRGRINPSGKLAISFPYSVGQIPVHYNRRPPARPRNAGEYRDLPSEPLYPFGYGLSYTRFDYGPIRVSQPTFGSADRVTLSVDVTNTGGRDGIETVHWFIHDKVASVTRPMKELKHFERKEVRAGETVTFVWELDPQRDLSFVDRDGRRHLEAGEFVIYAGAKALSVTLE